MRAILAIALLVFGIGTAAAADLPLGPRGPHGAGEHTVILHQVYGEPAGQMLIVDVEPGVLVRPYWLPGWRHRHYFPFGGRHRVERVNWVPPEPAETFHRSWSTCDICGRVVPAPPLRARDEATDDDMKPSESKKFEQQRK